MPPHGHHGGGHHGGHGHHHGGGGFGPAYGPAFWYPEPAYAELVPTCPDVYSPVKATDGRVYDNECLARAAGTSVVSRVKLSGFGDIVAGVPDLALFAVGGLLAYFLMRR